MSSGIKVTATDIATGEVLGEREIPDNDYFVIATGSCTYAVQAYGNGTHVVTFKGRSGSGQVREGGTDDGR